MLSAHNPKVVRLARLSARRRARESEGLMVADGPILVSEALAAGIVVHDVFVDASRIDAELAGLIERAERAGASVHGVSAEVLERVTDPVHPQPIVAVTARPVADVELLDEARSLLVLVGVADPGNAGTLVRAALGAGITAVGTTAGTVELFSPKALRSSAGAALRIPIIDLGDEADVVNRLTAMGFVVIATTPHGGVAYDSIDLTSRCAILIGNEAHGLAASVVSAASHSMQIPMAGPLESLNAAMAGTLVCFEVLRQRRSAGVDMDPTHASMGTSVVT